jgi:DNA-binding transcriptional ArsR family regulator
VTIFLDGQNGASSSALADNATWFGGRDQAMSILRGLERALQQRSRRNWVRKLTGFRPTTEMPGILVVVEECHRIFTDIETANRWANIAREGRKVGIAILAASQHVGLRTFGGSDELRGALYEGNLIVLRTKSKTAVNMLGETGGVDPTTFPKLPGYGYKIAEDGDEERTVPFRAEFLPSAEDAEGHREKTGQPVPVPIVDEWFERTSDAELDEMTANAFGPAFLDRDAIVEKMRQDAVDLIEGRIPAIVEPDPNQPPPPPGTPRLVPVADLDEDDPEDEEQADTTRQLILQLLAEGSRTKKELEKLTGKSDSSVKQALRKLVEDGVIERLSRGVYALANTEAAV